LIHNERWHGRLNAQWFFRIGELEISISIGQPLFIYLQSDQSGSDLKSGSDVTLVESSQVRSIWSAAGH
jgi:hypothetical protein